jgi:penicillin amidase
MAGFSLKRWPGADSAVCSVAMRTHPPSALAVILGLAAVSACSSSSSTPTPDAGHDAAKDSPAAERDSGKDAKVGKDAPAKDAPMAKKDAPAKDAPTAKGDAGADAAADGGFGGLPLTETLSAPSLSAPVTVVRDQYGIPHIYGETLADVTYAEGYISASDRLVEMDLARHQAEGTLTELLGGLSPSVLQMDIGMRMHHLVTTAQASWTQLQASTDPNDIALAASITAYAAGINAYVADVGSGKVTFPTIGYTPASFTPWTEVDSIALGFFQAFELVFDADTEISFTQLQAAEAANFDSSTNPDLTARKGIADDFEVFYPQDPTFTLPSGWTGFNGDTSEAKAAPPRHKAAGKAAPARSELASGKDGRQKGGARKAGAAVTPGKARGPSPREMLALLESGAKTMHGIGNDLMAYQRRGSNNFILGPALTADGHVIIGNDTHLSLSNPPIFYLVQLVATGGQVPVNAMGASFPGIPGIVLGNNQHIAWAATDNYIDVTDVYQETLVNCSDGTPFSGTGTPCAVFNGMNVPATSTTETFKIGLFENISSTYTTTLYQVPQHGPIIPALDANNHVLPLTGSELSIKYTGYQPAQLLRAFMGVVTATTMQDAVAAFDRDFTVGGENWLIGDDQGNFGWTQVCTVPRRASGHAPWLVLPGDGSAEWGPSMDRHYIPHAYNPAAGFITTANNDPIGVTMNNDPFFSQPVVDGSPLYLGFNYDPGTRVGRMTKHIQADVAAGHKYTQADVASIQGDIVSEWGQAMAPTFIQVASDLAAEIATPGTHADLTAIATAADPTARGLVQKAHDIMAAWTDFETWSGQGTENSALQVADSQATLLNAVFFSNLAHLALDDEIAVLGVTPFGVSSNDEHVRKLITRMCTAPSTLKTQISSVTGDNILFDNLNTPGVVESKEQIAAQAIVNTLDYIVTALGSDPTKWTWGGIHTLTFEYLIPLGTTFNIPSGGTVDMPQGYPRHGDDGTVDVGPHGLSLTDYTYVHGPAIRFGADLNPAGITAQNALPGGEIFDPTSPHYADQVPYWLNGQPPALAETLAAVTASAATEYAANKDGRIVFTP